MLPLQSSVSELPKFWAATFCPNPDFLSYERGNSQNSLLWVYYNHQFTLAVTYLYNYGCFSFLLAITNTIGELFCGWISDRSFVNSLTVYNTYVFITGISIFFMPFCYSYIQFVSVISVYGFFSGFDTCESIICVEILGKNLLKSVSKRKAQS